MPAIIELKNKVKDQQREIEELKKQLENERREQLRRTIRMVQAGYSDAKTNESLISDIEKGAELYRKRQKKKKIFHETISKSLVEAKNNLKEPEQIVRNDAVLALKNPFVQEKLAGKNRLESLIRENRFLDIEFIDITTTLQDKAQPANTREGRMDDIRKNIWRLCNLLERKMILNKKYGNTGPIFSIGDRVKMRVSLPILRTDNRIKIKDCMHYGTVKKIKEVNRFCHTGSMMRSACVKFDHNKIYQVTVEFDKNRKNQKMKNQVFSEVDLKKRIDGVDVLWVPRLELE